MADPPRANADPITVDQANVGARTGGWGVAWDQTLAQTLTIGVTGGLTQIDLGIFNPNDPSRGDPFFPDPLTIELRDTSPAGAPGGNLLYSWTVPVADVTLDRDALTSFALTGLDVLAGQKLAIVLFTGANGNYGWSTACCYGGGEASIYGGGDSFAPNPNHVEGDFIFRTYVDPQQVAPTPEPATLILLGLGLGTVSMVSRRSSRLSRGCSRRSTGSL